MADGPHGTYRALTERYIALFRGWLADPSLEATRILHEGFHYAFPDLFHGHRDMFYNAFRWQDS